MLSELCISGGMSPSKALFSRVRRYRLESQLLNKVHELKLSLESEYQTKLEQSQNIAKDKLDTQGKLLQDCIHQKEMELKSVQNELAHIQSKYKHIEIQLEDVVPQLENLRQLKDEVVKLGQKSELLESSNTQLKSQADDLNIRLDVSEQELIVSRSSKEELSTKLSQIISERDSLLKKVQEFSELKEVFSNNQITLKVKKKLSLSINFFNLEVWLAEYRRRG